MSDMKRAKFYYAEERASICVLSLDVNVRGKDSVSYASVT